MFDWNFNAFPVQASSWAARVDWINGLINLISILCTIGVVGTMIAFAIIYRRRGPNDKTSLVTHNTTIETVWTVIPTLICIYMFWYGYDVYHEMRNPPPNAIDINVEGQKWSWTFFYENGKKTGNELVVPVGQPVRLIMKSRDVNHSFYIPAMRIKEDVIGSQYNYLWFTPTITGTFPVFCAEYCGKDHSGMQAVLRVVTSAEYQDFLTDRGAKEKSPEELGAELFAQKSCNSCHNFTGTNGVGPTLKGVFGHDVVVTEAGAEKTVTADENYLRNSILNANAQVVKGFAPVMPSFAGQLTDAEVAALIAYIKKNS